MHIGKETVTNGLLAEFGYVKLESYNHDIHNIEKLKNFIDDEKLSGVKPDRQEAMKEVLQNYNILDFKTTDSGMQAMFLQEKSTGETKLLFRGTEFEASGAGWNDLVVADGKMAFGKATEQMQDAA